MRLRLAPIALRTRHPPDAEPEGHVGPDVEVGEQAVALEDHADVALVRRHAHDVGSADGDAAGVRVLEAGGEVVGIVPSADPADANPYCTHVVATGIGHARNLAVVASGDAVVALLDDSAKTLTPEQLARIESIIDSARKRGQS